MLQPIRNGAVGVAALAALALGGSAIADATTSTTTATTTQSNAQARPMFNGRAHGTPAHENAEKPVTGTAAAKAQAVAVKSVGGGTAGAVTSDLAGAGFETTVTKSDGTKVEVHLDSSYQVMQGPGGHSGLPPAGYGG